MQEYECKKTKKADSNTEINKKKLSEKEIKTSEEPLTKIIEKSEDLFIDNSMKIKKYIRITI